jgi:dihydroorotate dehydrogenase
MGFPGAGVDAVAMNLIMRRKRPATIGINIGPNKTSVEAGLDAVIADCHDLVRRLASLCTYLVLNVSSPNTAKLRDLQAKAALGELLAAVQSSLPPSHPTPLFVKIAPDLAPSAIDDIIDMVLETGLSGVIATNTTSARPPFLKGKWRNESGGLSGEPLRTTSLDVIRQIATATKGTLPIIGVGGIASGADALAALRAGAWCTQTYTGMIYQGPGLARAIKRSLSAELDRSGMASLKELREESLRL